MKHLLGHFRHGCAVYLCGTIAPDTLELTPTPLEATCPECISKLAPELRPARANFARALDGKTFAEIARTGGLA